MNRECDRREHEVEKRIRYQSKVTGCQGRGEGLAAPDGGEPSPIHGELSHEEDTEPEDRHRHTELCDRRRRDVHEAPAP